MFSLVFNCLSKYIFFFFSVAFFPLQIGDHVFIGEGSIVNAAVVSSYVYIGKNVIIGRRCVLKGFKTFQPLTFVIKFILGVVHKLR